MSDKIQLTGDYGRIRIRNNAVEALLTSATEGADTHYFQAPPMLDIIDFKILEHLQTDAKTPQAVIAERVGLSTPAVNERIRKLELAGVIQSYVARLNPAAVGMGVSAFVEVYVEKASYEAAFIERMQAVREVQEIHHVTGESSLILKVRTQSIESLRALLIDVINASEGVRQTRTAIVLDTLKEETRIALGAVASPPAAGGINGRVARRRLRIGDGPEDTTLETHHSSAEETER